MLFHANNHIKYEHRALVILVKVRHANDGTAKAALHKRLGYDRKYIYHRHDAIVF